MYFEDFPNFLYEFDINGKRKAMLVTDITRNIRFRRDVLSNITVYDEYDIVDGETPEIIAEKVYGDSQYHWVIMLANNIFDYRSDWVLSQDQLYKFVEDKYGDDADATHHYEDSNGFVVNSFHPDAASVSNRQYEEAQNEKKRRIKIIEPSLLTTVLQNYKDLI